VLIAVVALLGVLGCSALAVAAAGAFGVEPPWLSRVRHALGEARHRAGGVLAEFGDWLRLGR
jgi:hypothetical protein